MNQQLNFKAIHPGQWIVENSLVSPVLEKAQKSVDELSQTSFIIRHTYAISPDIELGVYEADALMDLVFQYWYLPDDKWRDALPAAYENFDTFNDWAATAEDLFETRLYCPGLKPIEARAFEKYQRAVGNTLSDSQQEISSIQLVEVEATAGKQENKRWYVPFEIGQQVQVIEPVLGQPKVIGKVIEIHVDENPPIFVDFGDDDPRWFYPDNLSPYNGKDIIAGKQGREEDLTIASMRNIIAELEQDKQHLFNTIKELEDKLQGQLHTIARLNSESRVMGKVIDDKTRLYQQSVVANAALTADNKRLREGYSPQEKLPEDNVDVLVQFYHAGNLTISSIWFDKRHDERVWLTRPGMCDINSAIRWWPMPSVLTEVLPPTQQ